MKEKKWSESFENIKQIVQELMKSKKAMLYGGGILILAIAGWLLYPMIMNDRREPVATATPTPSAGAEAIYVTATPIPGEELFRLRIEGNVVTPGEYYAMPGETIHDIVKRAGGFTKDADTKEIDLDAEVRGGDFIFVP